MGVGDAGSVGAGDAGSSVGGGGTSMRITIGAEPLFEVAASAFCS